MKKTPAELAEFLGITEDEAKMMMSGYTEANAVKHQGEMMMNAVALSIGLAHGTKQPDVVARLSALSTLERSVLAQLKATDHATALGALSGLIANAEKAAASIAELAAVKAQRSKDVIETLLSAARSEKKLTPAEVEDQTETGLRATALSMGDKAESWLKAHLAKRVPHTALSTEYKQPDTKVEQEGEKKPAANLDGKTYAQLSNMEKDELSRRDPEAFEKLRAAHLNAVPQPGTYPIHGRAAGLFRELPS